MNTRKSSNGLANLRLLMALVAGLAGGVLIANYTILGRRPAADTAAPAKTEREALYWVAPMDPNFRRDEPGKSPMGMDLVPVFADDASNGDTVSIDPAVVQNLGVRTSKAQRRALWRKVYATGYVGYDESRLSQINVRTEGWIQKLLVETVGQRVQRGQLLFEFYSPQLVNAQKEYVQAKRRGDSPMVRASGEKLLALGMEPTDLKRLAETSKVSNSVEVLAPQDGIVTRLNVQEGKFLKPDTEVLGLADLSTVWLQAEVFESQADWVRKGQSVEARLNYIPGEVFTGRVDYVYPVLDAETRTLQVRLRFDNPDERLKPNMYARVTIFGTSHPGALSIPREALIRGQETDRVVVALGGGEYTVHEVISGIESGNWVEIIAGLEAGDDVVTSAQFLIDSEASLAGSVQRLDAAARTPGADRNQTVYANGVIDAVNTQARRVRISHGPVEALGWSAMTMEFDVLPPVDLAVLKAGQHINFSLRQSDSGDFEVQSIRRRQPDDAAAPGEGDS